MAARRLPVLQGDSEPQRPTRQWIVIGAGLTLTSWLPLAVVASWIARRLAALQLSHRGLATLLLVAPSVLSFVLAASIGGALIAYFGARIGWIQTLASGALSALGAWLVALLAGALRPWPVALVSLVSLLPLGAGASSLGGALVRAAARRRIKKADPGAAKT